ncbi:MAG TPA: T9SS type A sorting domain-containing protein [Saprospiraceae bacterium]|nr:T9SS type A sorting domain-containing protein [Saprospiraceae bacterium]
MRIPLLFLSLGLSLSLCSEGTREMAPNANIVISGNNTTDIAALLSGNSEYNNFATYGNPDPNSRLYIHIADPDNECIFLGFSFGHANVNGQNPTRIEYEYRVRDPNGNIVFGPVTVSTAGGNINNWSEAHTGPIQLYGAGGYNAMQIMSSNLTSQGWSGAGDYFIEFNHTTGIDGLLIDFWDISVTHCAVTPLVERKGRVWSYNWAFFAINDFGFPNRPFNGAFYVCAPDPDNIDAAFITKIDFNGSGFRPAAFNVAFNSFGSQNTGNVMVDRRSVEGANSTQAEYSVFLNDPVDLCATAEPGEIELLGVSRCGEDDYCIKFIASKEGQIDLLLDFDGPDDVYTMGTTDVMVAILVDAENVGKPSCVYWNGKDGLGNALPEDPGTQIPVVISFAQGIYHFPIYDAEYMTSGVSIEAIRPPSAKPLLYYDDSNIGVVSGSGEPPVQLTGCITPCHRWTNFFDPGIPGFGNLNTINSWWFSQRIVRSSVFFLPAYLSCGIDGPERICEGETVTLTWNAVAQPVGTDVPEVISNIWSGPAIVGTNEGQTITISGGGVYQVDIKWLTELGDTCASACEIQVVSDPVSYGSIDTLIIQGETIEINGQTYGEGGQFMQLLVAVNGCDSILTIRINVLQTVVHFSLDACLSVPGEGSDAVYTEFTPEYPDPLSCAALEASIAHRDNPTVNTHSCTPGVNDSPAICVSSYDNCTYDAGNEKSFVFELTVTPSIDTAVAVTGLTFYERGPLMFDWINGTTGPNNYPTLYGVRVLKDGVEIYRAADIPTTTDWTLESFDFLGIDDFVVDSTATFRFEFLGYCLVGNGAMVPAWDLDEIRVVAGCVSPAQTNGIIAGRVLTEFGRKITDVEILLSDEPTFINPVVSITDQTGAYAFTNQPMGDQYYLRAFKNTDFLHGVSTLDLIRIQKHLLGLKEFDSPLQFIAADASGNNVVSVLDIVHLRKLLLGLYTELPGNTSWRFGKPNQELPLSDPWSFDEIVTLPRQDLNRENVNFLAVKIGDVNGSVNNLESDFETRSDQALHFEMSNRYVAAGEFVQIDITSTDFTGVLGFQCGLTLHGALWQEVRSGALDMTDAFAMSESDQTIRMSWNHGIPQTVSSDEVLFTIVVHTVQSGYIAEMIHLNNGILHAEAYVGDEEEVIDVIMGTRKSGQVLQGYQLFQNVPNPFSSETQIRFYLEKAGNVTVTIFSLAGTSVYVYSSYFEQGIHTMTISGRDIDNTSGILFYQLQSNDFVESKKMILLE